MQPRATRKKKKAPVESAGTQAKGASLSRAAQHTQREARDTRACWRCATRVVSAVILALCPRVLCAGLPLQERLGELMILTWIDARFDDAICCPFPSDQRPDRPRTVDHVRAWWALVVTVGYTGPKRCKTIVF